MKKLAVFLAALMLLSSLAACSSSKTPETEYDSSGRPQDSQNAVSTTGKTVTTIPVDKLISESEAKSIAFKKTGVSKAAVSALEIDLDYDNDQKRWEYEVDFYVDKVEYEVDIDAETGEVVLFKKDDDTVSKKSKSTTKTTVATTTKEPTESVSTTTSSKLISKDEAKKVALEKAGVKDSDVSNYRIKTDYDDDRNRWEYEIDFYVGKVEYDVTIDAATGAVLEFEKEDEEDKRQATATTKPQFLSKDDVKDIAMLCSGVSESKLSNYEVELEYNSDEKRWEYEISFNVGRIEHDIVIDAVTGELINWEKEIDD